MTIMLMYYLKLCLLLICAGPWGGGVPGHKAFMSSVSLIIGNSPHSPSVTFPEFQWADPSSF